MILDLALYMVCADFIAWMTTINNMTEEEVKQLTPENYLHGYCEDLAVFFAVKFGVDVLFLNNEHNLVKINDKYYDGADTKGVSNLTDLQYVKTSERLSKKSEACLQRLLVVDNEWREYRPLANNISLIKKINNQKED